MVNLDLLLFFIGIMLNLDKSIHDFDVDDYSFPEGIKSFKWFYLEVLTIVVKYVMSK